MRTGIRRRKTERIDTAHALRDRVERQLSAAANASPAAHNDPLYSITETFQQNFQRVGRARAAPDEEKNAEQSDAEKRPEEPETSQAEQTEGAEQKESQAPVAQKPGEAPKTEERANAEPMQKFSTMAFERGELSAALLQGTGKIALISCLKRAVGKSERSATLFGLGAQTRNVPSRDPNQMMFHRDVAHSAVGLVVDALSDARKSVDSLAEMASGGELREKDGGATLQTMYPFLDDSRERALLAERRERLKGDCTPDERAILENAAVRAEALIAKKARMKEEFIQKLREVSDRAMEALAELEAPETLEEIAEALIEPDAPTPPPDGETPSEAGEERAEISFDAEGAETSEVSFDAESAETSEVSFDAESAETSEVSFDAESEENVSGEPDAEVMENVSGAEGAETSEVSFDAPE